MQTFMIDRKCGPKNFPNEAEASYPPYLILFLLFLILLLPLSLLKEDRLVFWPGMFLREKQDQHFHFDSGQSWIHVESFWSRWFVQFQCLVSRQLNVIWPGKRCHAGLSVLNDLTYISCQALVFIWIHSQLFMCIFKSNKCLHVWVALCARMSVCVHFYCSYLVLLDVGQIPAEAQTDLSALPVLQEKNRCTNTEKKWYSIWWKSCSFPHVKPPENNLGSGPVLLIA